MKPVLPWSIDLGQRQQSQADRSSVLITVAAVLLVDVPGATRLAREIQGTAHAPAFALVAWLLVKALNSLPRTGGSYLCRYISICALLAIGTEALQYVGGRDASFVDVGRDLLGTVAAQCVIAVSGIGFRMRPRTWLSAHRRLRL